MTFEVAMADLDPRAKMDLDKELSLLLGISPSSTEWVLSNDGGSSAWHTGFRTQTQADDALKEAVRQMPGHMYKDSKAYQWIHYALLTEGALLHELIHKCLQKGSVDICVVETGVGPCFGVRLNAQGKVTSAKTLPIAICLFAKELFQKR